MENTKVFNCNICEKKYKSYQSLWNHNNIFHKVEHSKSTLDTPTLDELIYTCNKCNKKFDKNYKKYYHQNKCNNSLIQSIPANNTGIINNGTLSQKTSNINNGTINNNITINNYGNDKIDYISDKFKTRLFTNLKSDMSRSIPDLIENIKFNPNHKENNNVRITNDRSKIGFVYNDNKWKAINKNELLNDLYNYSYKIFKKYFDEKKEVLTEDIKSNYNDFERLYKHTLKEAMKEKIENIAYIFTKNEDYKLDD